MWNDEGDQVDARALEGLVDRFSGISRKNGS